MSGQSASGPDQLPIVDGSIYGITAYTTGYLATLVLVLVFEGERFVGDVVEGAGWIFYNAQFVPIEQRASIAGPVGERLASINYLTGQGLETVPSSSLVVPSIVYHAIPILAYVVAGFVLSRTVGARTPATGVKVGLSMVLGSVILAVGGTFLFQAVGQIGPNRLMGVLLVGLVYPGVCGGLGGGLAVLDR